MLAVKLAGTMRTANSFKRNIRRAEGGTLWSLLLLSSSRVLTSLLPFTSLIYRAQQYKYNKRDNQKAYNRHNEFTIRNHHSAIRLRISQRGKIHIVMRQLNIQITEINTTQQQTDGWHDDILHQTVNNRTKRATDDNTNSQV